jgi:hypothetical protein
MFPRTPEVSKKLSFREKSKNEPIDFYPESTVPGVQQKIFGLININIIRSAKLTVWQGPRFAAAKL